MRFLWTNYALHSKVSPARVPAMCAWTSYIHYLVYYIHSKEENKFLHSINQIILGLRRMPHECRRVQCFSIIFQIPSIQTAQCRIQSDIDHRKTSITPPAHIVLMHCFISVWQTVTMLGNMIEGFSKRKKMIERFLSLSHTASCCVTNPIYLIQTASLQRLL